MALTKSPLRESAPAYSARQQLAAAHAVRHQLHLRLSLQDPEDDSATAYRHVLATKGAVLLLQQQRRLFARLLADDRPDVRRQVEQLQQTTRSLASLALA